VWGVDEGHVDAEDHANSLKWWVRVMAGALLDRL